MFRRNILGFIIILFGKVLFAQTGNIEGTVKDSTGKTIEAASVVIQEKSISVLTDSKGYYNIKNLRAGNYTLVTNLIGYTMASKPVTVKENETTKIDFVLKGKTNELGAVTINGIIAITGMGHLTDVHDGVIYAGKKNEVLTLDSLNANTAQDNPRQVLGRVPGSNYSETEGNGFPSNGIGFRGLNPTQSIETNTRQNGYNITADLYGYPESYYLTPLEAVERI
ncbi:MAG TPA: carboxypeptidase-like regulatory domain-containing protein, partial [Bacteroidia bacterium]|nr:carboxypeptidase-like regulatory domain-containing protein [Bacteroidia bacterium]